MCYLCNMGIPQKKQDTIDVPIYDYTDKQTKIINMSKKVYDYIYQDIYKDEETTNRYMCNKHKSIKDITIFINNKKEVTHIKHFCEYCELELLEIEESFLAV